MPDYLAVGSDDDFVRMPMTPQTAQQIADRFGCILPTRKMVDAIDAQAELHLEPHPLTVDREAVATFAEHQQIIENQRTGKPLGLLITGIKKDIVLTPRIFEKPERLAIYGWRQLDGKPIQPLTIVHWNQYVDYSHGVRLVLNTVEFDGKKVAISDLLSDPKLLRARERRRHDVPAPLFAMIASHERLDGWHAFDASRRRHNLRPLGNARQIASTAPTSRSPSECRRFRKC